MSLFKLQKGDTIGIISPSWLVSKGDYDEIFRAIEKMGYGVCQGTHLYDRGWTFAASVEERVSDIHQMVVDDKVRMIFFGGGEGGDDIIPYLDYELIKKHPKIWMSFSDGTSILTIFRIGEVATLDTEKETLIYL